jgi:hypothetical protein
MRDGWHAATRLWQRALGRAYLAAPSFLSLAAPGPLPKAAPSTVVPLSFILLKYPGKQPPGACTIFINGITLSSKLPALQARQGTDALCCCGLAEQLTVNFSRTSSVIEIAASRTPPGLSLRSNHFLFSSHNSSIVFKIQQPVVSENGLL